MATVSDTTDAFAALAGEVHAASDSGRFGAEVASELSRLHTALNAALRGFHARPGGDAPARGRAIERAAAARRALAAAPPVDGALAAIENAVRALAALIAPAAAGGLRGSLRIGPARSRDAGAFGIAEAAGQDAGEPPPAGGQPNLYNRLVTLFPAEALTLYTTGLAIFTNRYESSLAVFLLSLLGLIILRWIANTVPDPAGADDTDRPAVAVAVIAFILWATATNPDWLVELLQFTGQLPRDPSAAVWATLTSEGQAAIIAKTQPSAVQIQKWASFIGAGFLLIASAIYTPKPPPTGA